MNDQQQVRHQRGFFGKLIDNVELFSLVINIFLETTIAIGCSWLFYWSLYVTTTPKTTEAQCQTSMINLYLIIVGVLHVGSIVLCFINLVSHIVEILYNSKVDRRNVQRGTQNRNQDKIRIMRYTKNISEIVNMIKIVFLVLSCVYLWDGKCSPTSDFYKASNAFVITNFVFVILSFCCGVFVLVFLYVSTFCCIGGTAVFISSLAASRSYD